MCKTCNQLHIMLVVADTTPINDLVLIGQVTILAALYEQVVNRGPASGRALGLW